jgi:hypothetical protein
MPKAQRWWEMRHHQLHRITPASFPTVLPVMLSALVSLRSGRASRLFLAVRNNLYHGPLFLIPWAWHLARDTLRVSKVIGGQNTMTLTHKFLYFPSCKGMGKNDRVIIGR